MEVVVNQSFEKDIKKCPSFIQTKAKKVINVLKAAKNLETSGLDYSKCKGSAKGEHYYRIRIGDWRIGVKLKHPSVIIITILARGQIYKRFPPK